jgi:hypothetical protein
LTLFLLLASTEDKDVHIITSLIEWGKGDCKDLSSMIMLNLKGTPGCNSNPQDKEKI